MMERRRTSNLKWKYNEETVGSKSSSASKNSEEDDECLKCGSDPYQIEWVSGTLVQGEEAKEELRKTRNRQDIHESSLLEE